VGSQSSALAIHIYDFKAQAAPGKGLSFRQSIKNLTATAAGKRRQPCGGHSRSESQVDYGALKALCC